MRGVAKGIRVTVTCGGKTTRHLCVIAVLMALMTLMVTASCVQQPPSSAAPIPGDGASGDSFGIVPLLFWSPHEIAHRPCCLECVRRETASDV